MSKLSPPLCGWRGVVVCTGVLAASTSLLGRPAAGQQVPSASPGSSIFRVSQEDLLEDDDPDDILGMLDESLEDFAAHDVVIPAMDTQVSTVSRTESTVARSPAAVYVLSNEMIRRSGVRSIPEALRLVPGMQVARINANTWAISIRGFNARFVNKLLVQIDGRTVYTPLFAGTFWDVQDVLLEDVERIEIIRGPGATVWGANAVNGVINIITKQASDSQGVYAAGGVGTERQFASARVGRESENNSWRAYGKWFDRDAGLSPAGYEDDGWHMGRFGFRSDWNVNGCNTVTVQGDIYDGNVGVTRTIPTLTAPDFMATLPDNGTIRGGNALFRWTHQIDDGSDWALQAYYDRTERAFAGLGFSEVRDTVDVDFQHHFKWRDRHSIVWGFGYRNTQDQITNSFSLSVLPTGRSDDRFSAFVQDGIALEEDLLFLTLGSKFSVNDYSGFEIQPTARLLYTPSNRKSIWGSVSRAVKTPARASDDAHLHQLPFFVAGPTPVFPVVLGDRNMKSENLLAWELGMRAAPTDEFYWDLAIYYNQYTDQETTLPGTVPVFEPLHGVLALPVNIINAQGTVETFGFELASTWQVHPNWTLRGAYSVYQRATKAADARNQVFIHSSWDVGCNWEFDLIGRYVDNLESGAIPSYLEMDTRLAWRPTDAFEFSVIGRNLLDNAHLEAEDDAFVGMLATQVQREVYGVVTLRY